MAALPHLRRHPTNTQNPLPTSYRRPSTLERSFPAGPCNYRDIKLGRHASNCGCQHFWVVEAYNDHQQDDLQRPNGGTGGAWCFCGHHACYHNNDPGHSADQDVNMEDIQENDDTYDREQGPSHEKQSMPPPSQKCSRSSTPRVSLGLRDPHKTGRPSSPRSKGRRTSAPARTSKGIASSSNAQPSHAAPVAISVSHPAPTGLGLYLQHSPRFGLHDPGAMIVNTIPSTRSASRVTEIASDHEDLARQSPSKNFAQHVANVRSQAAVIDIPAFPQRVNADDLAQSATEVATPSNAGTPALRGADDAIQSIKAGVYDLQRDLCRMQQLPTQLQMTSGNAVNAQSPHNVQGGDLQENTDAGGDLQPSIKPRWQLHEISGLVESIAAFRNQLAQQPSIAASLQGLSSRMDALESVSFSYGPVEDISDRLELLDGRLLEIEGKVDELEKIRMERDTSCSNNGSPSFSHLSRTAEAVMSDATSFRGATIERLRGLEERLESMNGPSPAQPWEVEVVFLPWGKILQGLWFDAEKVSQLSAQSCGDQQDRSEPNPRGDGRSTESSTVLEHDDEWSKYTQGWLSPRACGPTSGAGGRAYDRLRSRGFIRNVTFRDGSARHVHASICSTFKDVIALINGSSRNGYDSHNHETALKGPLLGLQAPFVPLRKMHKSSRLRFLSASELATPSLWTASLLESSVFMKAPGAGFTRLFVTTPSAYLQSQIDSGWTWQSLRELPRISPNDLVEAEKLQQPGTSFGSNGVDEADAREPCWEFHEKLDPRASGHSSFASNDSFQRHQQPNGSFASSHPLSPRRTESGSITKLQSEAGASSSGSSAPASEVNASSQSNRNSSRQSARLAPITPVSEFPPSSRLSLIDRRTASFPGAVLSAADSHPRAETEDPIAKRQVASFDALSTHYQTSPTTNLSAASLSKRRRLSQSPNAEAGARQTAVEETSRPAPWALTPRRSREPGSPAGSGADSYPQLMLGNVEVDCLNPGPGAALPVGKKDASNHGRQAAYAYATPYSGSGRTGLSLHDGGAGDTDMDISSDDVSEHADPEFMADEGINDIEAERAVMMDEEAWEGVGGGGEGNSDDDDNGEQSSAAGDDDDDDYDYEGDENNNCSDD